MWFYTFYYFDYPATGQEQLCYLDNNTIIISPGELWPDAHAAESHGPATCTLHQTPKMPDWLKDKKSVLHGFLEPKLSGPASNLLLQDIYIKYMSLS